MSEKKDIKIVSGDGKDLDISPVYTHLNIGSSKSSKKPKNIVVPKEKKDKKVKRHK